MKDFEEIIYEIDAMPGILDLTFEDGTSIWLCLRFDLRMINFKNSTESEVLAQNNDSIDSISLIDHIKYVFFTFLKSPVLHSKKVDVLTVANFEGSIKEPNIWTCFIKEIKEIKSIELLYSHKFIKFGKIANTYSLDYFYSIAKIKSKYKNKKNNKKEIDNINLIIDIISQKLASYIFNKDLNSLKSKAIYINRIIREYREQLQVYLKDLNPRLILTSEGNNGDWRYCVLFSVANNLKIKTAEVQHGAFGLGMKYANVLKKNDVFIKHKSDFLLTFGEYHNSVSNAAKENYTLGNYKLEKVINNNIQTNMSYSKNKRVVIVSEGLPASSPSNKYIEVISNYFATSNKSYELVVRLHPSELPSAKYNKLLGLDNCRYSLSEEEDLFNLIQCSDIIIGHTSTVLFEALYFNRTPIIFKDKVSVQYIPKELGIWFDSESSLNDVLENNRKNPLQKDLFWANGSVIDNFVTFYNNKILNNI
jgi:hypothetical protein